MEFLGTHIPLNEGNGDAESESFGYESGGRDFLSDSRPQLHFEAQPNTIWSDHVAGSNPNYSSPTRGAMA